MHQAFKAIHIYLGKISDILIAYSWNYQYFLTLVTPIQSAPMKLIISDEKQPKVTLKPGMKLEVVSVSLASTDLKKPKKIAARLCGGTSTCLALIEVGNEKK